MSIPARVALLAVVGFLVSCRPSPRSFEPAPDDNPSEPDDPSSDDPPDPDEQPEQCGDSIDNDQDFASDCADSDCRNAPECIPGAGPLGAPCTAHSDCAALPGNAPLCLTAAQGFPGGFCTEHCAAWEDRYEPWQCPGDGICSFFLGFTCLDICESDADCREGYDCTVYNYLPQCMPHPVCGDGVRQVPEACDGADGVDPCTGGSASCNSNCTLNTTDCPAPAQVCGNGVIEGSEDCDGDAEFDASCGEGYTGTRSCLRSICRFDDTCKPICGDGRTVAGETCEPGDTAPESCAPDGNPHCSATCDSWVNCTSPIPNCNDGQRALFETCDAQLPLTLTCQAFGFSAGELGCNTSCNFDTTACISTCGDGVKSTHEQCDGEDLGEAGCWPGGQIACNPDCSLDYSRCELQVCGDGIVNGFEECDGSAGNRTCESVGFPLGGELQCQPDCKWDTALCISICGDSVLSPNEVCDGDRGYNSCFPLRGNVTCTESCEIDRSDCVQPVCGDGLIEGNEFCDGQNLGVYECGNFGYASGTLTCQNCNFNTDNCDPGTCGDGFERGDECEFSGIRDCAGRLIEGRYAIGGTYSCTESCEIDGTQCVFPVCGDGVRSGSESCDGSAPITRTCIDLGHAGGTIGCTDNCELDESNCIDICGDGEVTFGESCDMNSTENLACEFWGFTTPGQAGCNECNSINIEACQATCGDGVREPTESCDGDDVRTTCEDLNHAGGRLSCTSACTYDVTMCTDVCGDGRVTGPEWCDGSDFPGWTCANFGFAAGTLSCTDTCAINTSGCTM